MWTLELIHNPLKLLDSILQLHRDPAQAVQQADARGSPPTVSARARLGGLLLALFLFAGLGRPGAPLRALFLFAGLGPRGAPLLSTRL